MSRVFTRRLWTIALVLTVPLVGCGDDRAPTAGSSAPTVSNGNVTTSAPAPSTTTTADALAALCAAIPSYMDAAELSDAFGAFLIATQDAGRHPDGPTIAGPDPNDGVISVLVEADGGRQAYQLRLSGVTGPSTAPPDTPQPAFFLDVGNTGYAVFEGDTESAACSHRFGPVLGEIDPPPSTTPGRSPTWFCVTGVADDDVLNLRSGAGVDHPVVYEIPPLACDIYRRGPEAVVDGSTWVEIDVYDHVAHFRGWVNASYIEERDDPCYYDSNQCGL